MRLSLSSLTCYTSRMVTIPTFPTLPHSAQPRWPPPRSSVSPPLGAFARLFLLPEGPPPDSQGAHSPTFFRILTNVTFLASLSLKATPNTPSPSPDLFSPHGHLPTVCLSSLCNKYFRPDEGEGLGAVKARTRGTRGQWNQLGATVMVLGPSWVQTSVYEQMCLRAVSGPTYIGAMTQPH